MEQHSSLPATTAVERVLQALKKDYALVGKTHIRAWQACLVIGVLAGTVAGVILVANRSGSLSNAGASDSSGISTAGQKSLRSRFFKEDKTALGIISGEIRDYSIMEFKLVTGGPPGTESFGQVDTFAFKFLSGLRQLGYGGFEYLPPPTDFKGQGSAYRPGLRLINRFQKDHNLPLTDVITKKTLLALDALLWRDESKKARQAEKLSIYQDLAEGIPNFPAKDHRGFLYKRLLEALPTRIRTEDRSSLLNFSEFYYPRRYPEDKQWPPIIDRHYYAYSGLNPPTELWSLPNDFDSASVFLHEYGHFLASPVSIEGYVRPPIVDAETFYEISWNKVVEGEHEYWKTKDRVDFERDFVSGYAGAEIGYKMAKGTIDFRTYPYQTEDFAESFSLYVLQGRVFRDKIQDGPALRKKYNWLKTVVFQGREYDTGNGRWRENPILNKTPRPDGSIMDEVAGNVQFYSGQDPTFVWDYIPAVTRISK